MPGSNAAGSAGRSRILLRRALPVAVSAAAVLGLAGCTPTVSLDPADDAANPGCAEIVVRLPDEVAGAERRDTDAQATAAWGSPASVLLHCGVAVPGPTTQRCISIDDVDWIEDASDEPVYTYTSYGRDPATEVTIDSTLISASTVLTELTPAVGALPAQGGCVGAEDVD